MLSITIVYDGENVEVNQHEMSADAEQLVTFINRWQTVAEEPCSHGHKCEVVKRMISELKEILGG